MRIASVRRWLAAGLAVLLSPALAATYELAPGQSVVGDMFAIHVDYKDTLVDIARRFNLGNEALRRANPHVDPWLPGDGTQVVIPARFVLPPGPREGIVLNLAERRLYYYPPRSRGAQQTVITHPVGIGRSDWPTPLGETQVVEKVVNPTWYPPLSVRVERAAQGNPVQAKVPPGPDNPLGNHAWLLGKSGYLIHGTNKPAGIGGQVSHGCVRMYPEDIKALFNRVPVGTSVRIIDQRVKAGVRNGRLYVEAHPSDTTVEVGAGSLERIIADAVNEAGAAALEPPDWDRVDQTVRSAHGIPVPVTSTSKETAEVAAKRSQLGREES